MTGKLRRSPCAVSFWIIKDDTLRLYDVITDCIQLKLSGAATDNVIQCFGGNILTKEKPVLAIEVSSKKYCSGWCKEQRMYMFISAQVLLCKCNVCTNCPLSSSQNLFYEIKRPFLVWPYWCLSRTTRNQTYSSRWCQLLKAHWWYGVCTTL